MAPQWASANNERGNAIKNTATLPVRGSSFRTQCPPRLASNLPEKIARACLSGPLGDLWIFDLALSTWAELPTALGSPPGPRAFHGFASLGGLLYVHGGQVEWCSRIGTLFVCRGGWALARLFVHWFKSIIILSRGWQSPAPRGGRRQAEGGALSGRKERPPRERKPPPAVRPGRP